MRKMIAKVVVAVAPNCRIAGSSPILSMSPNATNRPSMNDRRNARTMSRREVLSECR